MSIDHLRNVNSVHTGLREATAALGIGRQGNREQAPLSPPACEFLAGDLADTLEAVVLLLRSAGTEAMPTSSTSQHLQAVTHQLDACATIARRAGGGRRPRGSLVRSGAS